ARAVRGPPDAEGLRPHDPGGEALAGRGRGRGGRGVTHGGGLLAVAGESFANHWFNEFWIVLLIKVAFTMIVVLTAPLAVGYMEHKVLAHMQHRLGPMEAGRFHGWAQLVADGVKFIQKEDIVPAAADS